MSAGTLGAGFLRERRRVIAMRGRARGRDADAISKAIGDAIELRGYGDELYGGRFRAAVAVFQDLLDEDERAALAGIEQDHAAAVERAQNRAREVEQRERQLQESKRQILERHGLQRREVYLWAGEQLQGVNGHLFTAWNDHRDLHLGVFERDLVARGTKAVSVAGAMAETHGLVPPGERRPGEVAYAIAQTGVPGAHELAMRCLGVSVYRSAVIGDPSGAEMLALVEQVDQALKERATAGGRAA